MSKRFYERYGFDVWICLDDALENAPDVRGLVTDEEDDLSKLEQFTNLEFLDLSGCAMEHVPPAVFSLKKLRALRLASGDPYANLELLQDLSPQIANLKELEYLTLSGQAEIKTLPPEIGALPKLKVLILDTMTITHLPDTIRHLRSLEHLSMRWLLSLEHFPETVCELTTLTVLDIMQTKMQSVPSRISNLARLERLNLNFNRNLRQISATLFALTNLRDLRLRDIGATLIPAEIAKLQKLDTLDLSKNTLGESLLPLTDLPQLTKLTLENCAIKTLPARFSRLERLAEINLCNNPISEIPHEITWPAVQKIDLRGTHADLQTERAHFPHAKVFK